MPFICVVLHNMQQIGLIPNTFFLTKQVQTVRNVQNYHIQTAGRTADDSMLLVSVCIGAFSNQCNFPYIDFSYKNVLEKMT